MPVDSWLDLEQRFRSLTPGLRFYRLDAQWGAAGEYWRIAGAGRTPATEQFELLSSLGGRLLEKVLTGADDFGRQLLAIDDPKVRWYNALKVKSASFGNQSYAQQTHDDGTSAGFIFTGSLSNMTEASANLCLAFHTSHPVIEHKSKWQWLHDNYLKALIVGIIVAIAGAAAKWLFG